MAIWLDKNALGSDAFSSGDGLDPIQITATINGGDEIVVAPDIYVCCDNTGGGSIDSYTSITIDVITETDTGIDWELSTDGASWTGLNQIAISDFTGVSASIQSTQIWARCTATDGTATDNYTAVDLQITATENPPA